MSKKKAGGRARDRGEVVLLTVELDPALDAALETFRQRELRTKKSVISLALQEYLASRGAWPPKGKTE
jgi:predicted transcriptional regulator